MKSFVLAVVALSMAITPAFAGSKSTSNSNSSSSAGAVANNAGNHQSTKFENRLQAPGLGSFGGGGCPEGIMASGPGFGLGFQVQCKEYKRSMKYRMVRDDFGSEGSRRWQCETDKELYTLPQCRAYRMENSGRRR